ncbi:flagellar biosynthesis sigma factor [Bordetella sp. H567]|uniref:RNA polymerase sigma factor FliA n=1 Tax=Bordetella sp. H567 TaxID=1697043 RepID=UPI00081D2C1B|nr:RNA polymerase sigma factor FliA [Bordetella sp. H567]AOB31019.1 flagellar biosynthesis sigma factor [Bordetella sp. H567]
MPLSEDRLAEYAPLVRKLALQLLARLPASVELDDLIQAGMIGLLDAARRYQEVVDAQFETYATARIRGAMLDELRNQDWLPRSVRSKAKRIDQAVAQLTQQLMRPPTEAEIAGHLDLSLPEYHQLLYDAQGAQVVHYEDFGTENGADARDGDWVAGAAESGPCGNPLDSLLATDFRNALVEAIAALPDREKLLLSLCYEQGLNLKEVGAVMGVTEARVCQLRSQAMSRLRAKLKEGAWQQLPEDVRIAYVA